MKNANPLTFMTQDVSVPLDIAAICDDIKDLLLEKNAKYGNSALDPVRIFSKESPVDQLLVRIDDKLSRISRGAGLLAHDEDVLDDLIGYLVLLKLALRQSDYMPSYSEVLNFFDCQGEDPTFFYGGTSD